MSTVLVKDGTPRISTSYTYNSVKAIPNLNLPALHRTHSAGSASVASISPSASPSEREGRQAIPRDEPCFITKTPGYSLEKAHLVNAVTGDEILKYAVESFLVYCNIVYPSFTLNSASNLIPLDRDLHYTLEKLGFFAITCSKPTLLAMLDVVKEQIIIYDEREGVYNRLFEYEMVVLHPHHFLPVGCSLAIHTKDPNDPSRLVGKAYRIGTDGALREGKESTSPRFSAFSYTHTRAFRDRVNPLLVVLKAHMAFRRFVRLGEKYLGCLCPEYRELVELTIKLADALYHPLVTKVAARAYRTLVVGDAGGTEDMAVDEDVDMNMGRDATGEPGVGNDGNVATAANVATNADKGKTVAPKKRGGRAGGKGSTGTIYSRLGKEVKDPGPGAPPEEMRDYLMYIMSGRDIPLDRDDEDILHSIGLHPDDEPGSAAS